MAEFICHGDFAELVPVDVYGKEMAERELPEHPESLKNRHILYRRRFTLGAFDRAVLKISADDYYKLYVNGRFIAMGPAASYPHCYNYNEIDISEYLLKGENVIAVLSINSTTIKLIFNLTRKCLNMCITCCCTNYEIVGNI